MRALATLAVGWTYSALCWIGGEYSYAVASAVVTMLMAGAPQGEDGRRSR